MAFRYREVRKKKGFTLEQAAQPLGRTKQWLSEVERENIKIGYEEAVKLAKVYGETPDIFLPSESDNIGQNGPESNPGPKPAA